MNSFYPPRNEHGNVRFVIAADDAWGLLNPCWNSPLSLSKTPERKIVFTPLLFKIYASVMTSEKVGLLYDPSSERIESINTSWICIFLLFSGWIMYLPLTFFMSRMALLKICDPIFWLSVMLMILFTVYFPSLLVK